MVLNFHGKSAFSLALLASAALAGCASVPGADVKPATTYATATSFSGPNSEWPAEDWWSAYGDPQLTGLITEALADSPTMAQAAARLHRAQALAGQARAASLPSLALEGGVQELKQSYNTGIPPQFVPQGYNDVGRVDLNLGWELDFWGKHRAAIAAATSESRAAAADAAEARLVVSTSVASAYADLAALYADRDVAERTLTLRNETSDLVQKRVDNGLDTDAELNLAKAGPPAARAQLGSIDEQISLTRNRLAALLGAGPDRGLTIRRPVDMHIAAFGLPENLAADLIGRRPDIVAARWRAEASKSRIKEAKASFLPNINLAAVVGYQALYLDKLFDSGSDYGSVGPAVSLPIFEGGRLRANLHGAEAGRDDAVATYDATVVQALRDVADVVASEKALSGQLADSRAALDATEAAYRVTRLRYQGELANYQSVLISEQQLLAQRRTVADLESRAFSLDIALVRALGGGFASDAAVNSH
ncbi:MAG: efflux transporter outer membrane subunit [Alphaproteobacteria bacterium]|nr:efflux transporter outer membrane subunit [Alphaproteobacteria bacterium]